MVRGTITFTIAADVPVEEHQDVLDAVAAVEHVVGVQRLLPGTEVLELLRMGIATVHEGADPLAVAEVVAAVPGIDYAAVAAERGLS